jgi:hypothetical protein
MLGNVARNKIIGWQMPKPKEPKIELREDGWDRFTHAVDAAVKSGPKHRPSKKTPSSQKPEGDETQRE